MAVGLECMKKVRFLAFLFLVFDNGQKSAIFIHKLSNCVQASATITKTAPVERFINPGSGV